MNLTERDRRALILLAMFVAGMLLYLFISGAGPSSESGASMQDAITAAERRLDKTRQIVAQVPAHEQIYKQVAEQLAVREKRVLVADTAQQAQAQLLGIIRKVARTQNPAVEIRSSEFSAVRQIGDAYGEAPVSVTMECGVDQLLNIVSELTAQPELASVSEMRVYSANQRQKTTNVRLTVSAIVPRRLAPERKGAL